MRDWMVKLREAKGLSLRESAKACSKPDATVTIQLLEYIEYGSWTLPVFTKEIGRVYGMTRAQVKEITKNVTYQDVLRREGVYGAHIEVKQPKERKAGRKYPLVLDVSAVALRAAKLGESYRELSAGAGMNPGWINVLVTRALDGGSICYKTARRLAQALQCDEAAITRAND